MRFPRLLALATLALLLCVALPALAVAIPEYTPNVVDPAAALSDAQRQQVNDALQQIREQQNIWGAVYVVPSIEGEDIEQVADAAFRKWQLGSKGANNGLLLVLAMQDRRSRFEVGYGLEGVLPDAVARRALDDHLAPKMRQGDTAGAIVEAFDFMARVAAKDPESLAELSRASSVAEQDERADWTRGAAAWAGMFALIWLLPPVLARRQRGLRTRLLQRNPDLADAPEEIATSKRKRASSGAFIKIFLTINPGVFVLVLSSLFLLAFWLSVAAEVLTLCLMLALSGRRYRSPARYRAFLQEQERMRKALIRKGHVVRTEGGTYAYTPAYYASEAASSSSSSSSSDSSSSGGGSSGGGGASSSW